MDKLQRYLEYLQFERGLSSLTVKHYQRNLELKSGLELDALQPSYIVASLPCSMGEA